MPWCTNAACTTPWRAGITSDPIQAAGVTAVAAKTTLQEMADTGELKSNFNTIAGDGKLGKITIWGSSVTNSFNRSLL